MKTFKMAATISFSEITDVLVQKFTDVKSLVKIESMSVIGATEARTTSIFSIGDFRFTVGVYTLGSASDIKSDVAEWVRFLVCNSNGEFFTF